MSFDKKIPLNILNVEQSAMTCSLPDTDLIERKKELRNGVFDKVVEITESNLGMNFFFHYSRELNSKLIEFIDFERKCCSFLHFSLHFSNSERIILELYGKPDDTEATSMVKNWVKEQFSLN